MPSFKKFYKENRKKAIQSQKNSVKLLQLLMILCSYNFIKFSMCSYNFNVAVRISINHSGYNADHGTARIYHGSRYTDIDTGNERRDAGGRISCLRLDDGREFYV